MTLQGEREPETEDPLTHTPCVGTAMGRVREMAMRAARSKLSILILGETGVGKDVLAREIHRWSPRAKGPFVPINCSALAPTLVDSELFGHDRGAFTGALVAKPGLLEQADGGTVFLDELGELPLATQAKLLRVVEERIVTPVGRGRPRAIDVRFICATNREVQREIRAGTFRDDLYFRLASVVLRIPPLRRRRDEIAHLARLALAEATDGFGLGDPPSLAPSALSCLESEEWRGNIRELKNVVGRSLLLLDGPEITERHVRAALEQGSPEASFDDGVGADPDPERQRIAAVLRSCAGNQTKAAHVLGIARRTLISRLERYNFPRPQKALTTRTEDDVLRC